MAGYRERNEDYWGRTRGRTPGSSYRTGYDRGMGSPPAWTGAYRPGYQGGTGGYRTGGRTTRMEAGRGGEPWYLANRAGNERFGGGYDRRYREFDRQTRPGISPVGGNHAAMGGEYGYRGAPRGLRYDRWFSDRTRWF